MILYTFLAVFAGMILAMSRVINGRLGAEKGALTASLGNHVAGFLFLTLVLALKGGWKFDAAAGAPLYAYAGGFVGALTVAITSYVYPRIGVMNGALMVISGQMLSAVLIDCRSQGLAPSPTRCLGVVILILGVYLRSASNARLVQKKTAVRPFALPQAVEAAS